MDWEAYIPRKGSLRRSFARLGDLGFLSFEGLWVWGRPDDENAGKRRRIFCLPGRQYYLKQDIVRKNRRGPLHRAPFLDKRDSRSLGSCLSAGLEGRWVVAPGDGSMLSRIERERLSFAKIFERGDIIIIVSRKAEASGESREIRIEEPRRHV